MQTSAPSAFAMNAARTADAIRSFQLADIDGTARLERLTRHEEGWYAVLVQIAQAAEMMERWRVKYGATAAWGRELPDLYDTWDAIGLGLWQQLGAAPLEVSVRDAIERATNASTTA